MSDEWCVSRLKSKYSFVNREFVDAFGLLEICVTSCWRFHWNELQKLLKLLFEKWTGFNVANGIMKFCNRCSVWRDNRQAGTTRTCWRTKELFQMVENGHKREKRRYEMNGEQQKPKKKNIILVSPVRTTLPMRMRFALWSLQFIAFVLWAAAVVRCT